MTARLVIAGALLVVAAITAFVLERTRARRLAPLRPRGELHQVNRADFERPDAPWLLLLFTSRDCGGCDAMAARVAPLESPTVAVARCEYHDDRALHERYEIDSVPYLVVVDADGVVRASFLGTASAESIWDTVHELTAK